MCLLLDSEIYHIISSEILLNHPGMCNGSECLICLTLILFTGEGNEHTLKVGGGSVTLPA